jgi:hypothetical protein
MKKPLFSERRQIYNENYYLSGAIWEAGYGGPTLQLTIRNKAENGWVTTQKFYINIGEILTLIDLLNSLAQKWINHIATRKTNKQL